MNIEKVIEELKKVNPEWDGAYRYYADTKRLDLEDTNISDITPLKGMPLKWLDLDNTNVSDLTPLKGMSLEGLNLDNTKVSDLTPLKGMPLKWLYLDNTKVSDLSPLKGMPLAGLDLKNTPAAEKPLPEWLDDNYIDVYGWEGKKMNNREAQQALMDGKKGSDKVADAFKVLKNAIKEDDEYAYGWHANIAMSCHDANTSTQPHKQSLDAANNAASRFMKLCFGVETSQYMLKENKSPETILDATNLKEKIEGK